jgi:hypothetical protein
MTTTNGMPEEVRISIPERTFLQRVRSMALWWGIPAVCVELFGVPRNLWLYVLILAIPATALGVVAGAAILHVAAARRNKASDGGNSST